MSQTPTLLFVHQNRLSPSVPGTECSAMVSGWGYGIGHSAKESYVCLSRVSRNVTQAALRLHMQIVRPTESCRDCRGFQRRPASQFNGWFFCATKAQLSRLHRDKNAKPPAEKTQHISAWIKPKRKNTTLLFLVSKTLRTVTTRFV